MRKLSEYYYRYLEQGLVLTALDPKNKRRPLNNAQRSFTTEREVDAWLAAGYQLGLSCGRWSGFVAVELTSLRGSLVLSAWSRGTPHKTWEYLSGDSYFYIYRLPQNLAPRDVTTFYSEQDHKAILSKVENKPHGEQDIRTKDFSPSHRAKSPRRDADIVVWGDEAAVPLPPLRAEGYRFKEIRPPELLKHLGGIPETPNWLSYAIEVNTVPKTNPDYLSSDVLMWLERNIRPQTNARVRLRNMYEAYIKENYEQGLEPRSERDFMLNLKSVGYTHMRESGATGRKYNYVYGLEPVPFSGLDRFLR